MKPRKPNISRWYLLGLAAIITVGCLMISVGTTLARYRVDQEKEILFTPKNPLTVAIGVMTKGEAEEEAAFDPNGAIVWTEQTVTGGEESAETKNVYVMNFALSNYLDKDKFHQEDLEVRVRLVGSLDAWNPDAEGSLTLTDGVLLEDGTPREIVATVTEIPENTAMYHAFGVGWVFQFLDESGRELTWTLKGGQLSCLELKLTLDASAVSGTGLLQLQITGEAAK